MAATITNVGLTMLAAALINGSADALVSYVAIGTGAATLFSGVTSGTPITSLSVNPLAANIAANQPLTIIYQTHVDTVTVTAAGASAGATSIPIVSWTPAYSFPAGAGLVNTPAVTDTALEAEAARVAVASAVAGASAGETLINGYFAPTTGAATYLEVGYFGGSAATGSAGTGTLVARDVIWWPHATLTDSFTSQLDSTV